MVEADPVSRIVLAPSRAEAAAASQPACPPPMTITSADFMMGLLYNETGADRNVSRETISFSNTKIAENHVQQILYIHSAGDTADGTQGEAQVFGG